MAVCIYDFHGYRILVTNVGKKNAFQACRIKKMLFLSMKMTRNASVEMNIHRFIVFYNKTL